MKKIIGLCLALLLVLSLAAGCSSKQEDKVITVGASVTPHSEILEAARPLLEKEGWELKIVEFTDYVQPNTSLDSGDLDANYFQHVPYLTDFNTEYGTKLVSAAGIHYEPLGIYPGKTASLNDLPDGAQVAVPNDTSNEARALLLLETAGLIEVDDAAGLTATVLSVTSNPKNLKIVEIEAAQLARSLQDVDIAVINGNYAIQAGLNASTDALAYETADSLAADTFVNIIAVREGEENSEKTKALVAALQSDTVRSFIEDTYQGAVLPKF
jgi:D-methionine transport system substrate-binding protein